MLKNEVRITGGEWRGKKLRFPSALGLRPTPDRVKITLFNWLNPIIFDARCLDLFSGSGCLGFEAASRGAKEVVLVEKNKEVADRLKEHQKAIHSPKVHLYNMPADMYLQQKPNPFDIIFCDPPFHHGLVNPSAWLLENNGWLKPQATIYVETEIEDVAQLKLPPTWKLVKQKKAGQLNYFLFRRDKLTR